VVEVVALKKVAVEELVVLENLKHHQILIQLVL
jgi:hypothetical protein